MQLIYHLFQIQIVGATKMGNTLSARHLKLILQAETTGWFTPFLQCVDATDFDAGHPTGISINKIVMTYCYDDVRRVTHVLHQNMSDLMNDAVVEYIYNKNLLYIFFNKRVRSLIRKSMQNLVKTPKYYGRGRGVHGDTKPGAIRIRAHHTGGVHYVQVWWYAYEVGDSSELTDGMLAIVSFSTTYFLVYICPNKTSKVLYHWDQELDIKDYLYPLWNIKLSFDADVIGYGVSPDLGVPVMDIFRQLPKNSRLFEKQRVLCWLDAINQGYKSYPILAELVERLGGGIYSDVRQLGSIMSMRFSKECMSYLGSKVVAFENAELDTIIRLWHLLFPTSEQKVHINAVRSICCEHI